VVNQQVPKKYGDPELLDGFYILNTDIYSLGIIFEELFSFKSKRNLDLNKELVEEI
jgi:hypothetical protein